MHIYKPSFKVLGHFTRKKWGHGVLIQVSHGKKNTILAVTWLLPVSCNLSHAAQSSFRVHKDLGMIHLVFIHPSYDLLKAVDHKLHPYAEMCQGLHIFCTLFNVFQFSLVFKSNLTLSTLSLSIPSHPPTTYFTFDLLLL